MRAIRITPPNWQWVSPDTSQRVSVVRSIPPHSMKSDALCSVVEAWDSSVNFTFAYAVRNAETEGFFCFVWFCFAGLRGTGEPSFFTQTASANSAERIEPAVCFALENPLENPSADPLYWLNQQSCGVSCLYRLFLQAQKIEFLLVIWYRSRYDDCGIISINRGA